jgi:heme/copper-type cytochrome/quinol oxidase subunit 1
LHGGVQKGSVRGRLMSEHGLLGVFVFLVFMLILALSELVVWWLIKPDTPLARAASLFLGMVLAGVVAFIFLLAVAAEE